jgi:hypothetical protein
MLCCHKLDLGQAVADPGRALLVAGAAPRCLGAIGAEVAVVLGLRRERRPGQFEQQHVVELAEQRLAVGDQVFVVVEVADQLGQPRAQGIGRVPAVVVEHRGAAPRCGAGGGRARPARPGRASRPARRTGCARGRRRRAPLGIELVEQGIELHDRLGRIAGPSPESVPKFIGRVRR